MHCRICQVTQVIFLKLPIFLWIEFEKALCQKVFVINKIDDYLLLTFFFISQIIKQAAPCHVICDSSLVKSKFLF